MKQRDVEIVPSDHPSIYVYTYDAIYRLINAKGREHIGQIATVKGQNFGPVEAKGYWSVIREGDDWKIRMLTFNQTPAPATPAETK